MCKHHQRTKFYYKKVRFRLILLISLNRPIGEINIGPWRNQGQYIEFIISRSLAKSNHKLVTYRYFCNIFIKNTNLKSLQSFIK